MPNKKKRVRRKVKVRPKRRAKKFPLINKLTKREEKTFLKFWDDLLAKEISKTRKRSVAAKRGAKGRKRPKKRSKKRSEEKLIDFLLEREVEKKEKRKKSARRIARQITKKFKSRPGEQVFKFDPLLKRPDLEFVPHLLDRAEINGWSIFSPVRLRVLMTWQRKDNGETRWKIFHYYAPNFADLLEYLVFRKRDFSEQFARSSLPRESVRETLQYEEVAIKNKGISSYGILFEKK